MGGYSSKSQVYSDLKSIKEEIAQLEEKRERLEAAEKGMGTVLDDWVSPASASIKEWQSSINAFGDFSWEGSGVTNTKNLADVAVVCFCSGDGSSYYDIYNRRLIDVVAEIANTNSKIRGLKGQRDSLQRIYNTWDLHHPS